MARVAPSHFGLIGTDLFLNCFGAIFLLTNLTPVREVGLAGETLPVVFEFKFRPGAEQACSSRDWGGVSFSFSDNQDVFTAFDMSGVVPRRENGGCMLSGELKDVVAERGTPPCYVDPDSVVAGAPRLAIKADEMELKPCAIP
jgi:hypothetical protein